MKSSVCMAVVCIVTGMLDHTGAWAGYKDLLNNWKTYESTAYYESKVSEAPPAKIPAIVMEDEFAEQRAKLREMKVGWKKAIKTMRAEEVFYRPDESLVHQLGPAVEDAAAAAEVLKSGFRLEDLEALAFWRNPGVKAAEERFQATLESYNQVWNLDEIIRQYTAFIESLMTGVGPMKGKEPVQLRFPFPGVMALKGEVVDQEVKFAWQDLDIARRRAVTAGRKSFWELLFVRSAQDITGEMLGLLQHLEDVATTRYEAGQTSFQDVIKVRIQRELLTEDLKTLEERKRNVEMRILELLDLPVKTTVGTPVDSEKVDREFPALDHLYGLAFERKQEIKKLEAQVGKMERMIEMAETAIYPDYALNLSLYDDEAVEKVGTFGVREPFQVTTRASTGAGLPKMPWYGVNDAYLRETRKKLEALREKLEETRNDTLVQVREAWFRLDQARREESLYGERVINLSQAALEVSTRGYETGSVSFADVISSYTGWLRDNLALERKKSDLGVARADLEAAVGTSWR